MDLLKLAEEVEALDHESQPAWLNLENKIAEAMGVAPADFLTSLDAAMRLVPEAWSVSLSLGRINFAVLTGNSNDPMVPPPDYESTAVTPALALVSASLRAIAGEK